MAVVMILFNLLCCITFNPLPLRSCQYVYVTSSYYIHTLASKLVPNENTQTHHVEVVICYLDLTPNSCY